MRTVSIWLSPPISIPLSTPYSSPQRYIFRTTYSIFSKIIGTHLSIMALSKPIKPKETPSESLEASASPTPPEKPVKPIKKTPKKVVDNDDEASDDSNTPPKKPSKKQPKKPPKKSPKRIVGTDDESSDDGDGDSDDDRSRKKSKVIKLLPANAKHLRIQKQMEAQFTEAFQKIKGNKRKAPTCLKLDRYIAGQEAEASTFKISTTNEAKLRSWVYDHELRELREIRSHIREFKG